LIRHPGAPRSFPLYFFPGPNPGVALLFGEPLPGAVQDLGIAIEPHQTATRSDRSRDLERVAATSHSGVHDDHPRSEREDVEDLPEQDRLVDPDRSTASLG